MIIKTENSKELSWKIKREYNLIIHNKERDVLAHENTIFKSDTRLGVCESLEIDICDGLEEEWKPIDYEIAIQLSKYLRFTGEDYENFYYKIDFDNIYEN